MLLLFKKSTLYIAAVVYLINMHSAMGALKNHLVFSNQPDIFQTYYNDSIIKIYAVVCSTLCHSY